MSAYNACALSLLAVMTIGVIAIAVYLSRLVELRADNDMRSVLSWDGTGAPAGDAIERQIRGLR